MVDESALTNQISAMEGWAIKLLDQIHELEGSPNLRGVSSALKLARNVNLQGRKLEYRSSGLKKLPDMQLVKDLRHKITEARAAAQVVQGKVEDLERHVKDPKFEVKKLAKLADARKNTISMIHTLHDALALSKAEPWVDAKELAKSKNKEAFVMLLKGEDYYSRFNVAQRRNLRNHILYLQKEHDFSGMDLRGCDFENISGDDLKISSKGSTFRGTINLSKSKIYGDSMVGTLEQTEVMSESRHVSPKLNLKDADARGCKFSGKFLEISAEKADLRGCELSGYSFKLRATEADCRHIKIKNVDGVISFDKAKLSGALFEDSKLRPSSFDFRGDCIDAKLDGAKIINCEFSGQNFNDAKFKKSVFENVHFYGCRFKDTDFKGATLEKVSFDDCSLENAEISGSKGIKIRRESSLNDVKLINCESTTFTSSRLNSVLISGGSLYFRLSGTLNNVDFSNVSATNFHVINCDIKDSTIGISCSGNKQFYNCNLINVTFPRVSLKTPSFLAGAKFENSQLMNINLNSLNLKEVKFNTSELFSFNFSGSNLGGAIFNDSRLKNINFAGTDLTSVNFMGSNLSEVDFSGANLTGADFLKVKGLTSTMLAKAGTTENLQHLPADLIRETTIAPIEAETPTKPAASKPEDKPKKVGWFHWGRK